MRWPSAASTCGLPVVEPGPKMGLVLDRLLDRVLEDPSLNTREQLLALARTA